jgi:hypothetical protein
MKFQVRVTLNLLETYLVKPKGSVLRRRLVDVVEEQKGEGQWLLLQPKPGLLGRRQTTDPKNSISEVPMAMVGIVPTKVSAEMALLSEGTFWSRLQPSAMP